MRRRVAVEIYPGRKPARSISSYVHENSAPALCTARSRSYP
jgi:hypothetical protein